MRLTAMPELITGLTNLLIILSALGCRRGLRGRRGAGLALWRGFYFLLTLAAGLGLVVHCVEWGRWVENVLWLGFDLLLGAMLALLPLAAQAQFQAARPSVPFIVATSALGAVTAAVMMDALFSSGFRAQFGVAALAAVMSLCAYLGYALARLLRDGELRQYWACAALLLLAATALPAAQGGFECYIGPLLVNHVALLHLGLALAAPMFYLSIKQAPAATAGRGVKA